MKIPGSIRTLYASKREHYELLRSKVDALILSKKETKWHYESRVKSEESFALKIETGRFDNLEIFQDFFAGTVVVENQEAIKKALKLVESNFRVSYRRPKSDSFTSKQSYSFPFDDLRIYVSWQDDPAQRPTGLDGTIFEIQLKTFLQHAWAIATHGLVYKGDSVSWSTARIAYQIKAMLEHAEVSIAEASMLSQSSALKKSDVSTQKLESAIKLLKEFWEPAQLPDDIRRLADNVANLIKNLDISLGRLKVILREEAKQGRGPTLTNLSPYGIIVQSLMNSEPARLKEFLAKDANFKIVVPREIEIPATLGELEREKLFIINHTEV